MPAMARQSWSAELSDILRFVVIVLGVLVVAYIGYVVVIAGLGSIRTESNTSLEIDTGQLDRGPGTPTAVLVNTVQNEPELVGWSTEADFTARISVLEESPDAACFEVMTGTVYVAEAVRSGSGWSLSGIVRNSGPDRWTPVRGSVSAACLARIEEG
jgi:hypothetical protein